MTHVNHYDNDQGLTMNTCKLPKYEPIQKKHSIHLIMGSQRSGRSTLMQYLYSLTASQAEEVYVYTNNREIPYPMAHPDNVHDGLGHLASLSNLIKNEQNERKVNRVLIFDNCFNSGDLNHYRDIFMFSRHKNLDIFIMIDYIYRLPPWLRGNIDIIYLMSKGNIKINRTISEMVNYNHRLLDAIMHGCHQYEVIVKSNMSNDNQLYWYRVPENGLSLNLSIKGPIKVYEKLDQTKVTNKTIMIVGEKTSGKSQLMLNLDSYNQNIDKHYYILSCNNSGPCFPKQTILRNIEDLSIMVEDCKKSPTLNRVLIIEGQDNLKLNKNQDFIYIVTNGRHFNLTTFILCYNYFNFKPHIRNNLDLIFIFSDRNFSSNKYKNLLGELFPISADINKKLTDYEAMMINCFSNKIGLYRANLTSNYIEGPYIEKVLNDINLLTEIDENLSKSAILKKINSDDVEKFRSNLKQLKSLCSKMLDTLDQ